MADVVSTSTMQESPQKVESETNRRKRLVYRSWHRGTKEMDMLLGKFADAHVLTMAESQLDQYEVLLDLNDPDLYDWYSNPEKLPKEHNNEVMALFLSFDYKS